MRNTQSNTKEAELFRDTIDCHVNIFIHRMVFVCVERDSMAVLVRFFFLSLASHHAVEELQTSFSAFRCPSTAGLGAGSLPSSSSPVHTMHVATTWNYDRTTNLMHYSIYTTEILSINQCNFCHAQYQHYFITHHTLLRLLWILRSTNYKYYSDHP